MRSTRHHPPSTLRRLPVWSVGFFAVVLSPELQQAQTTQQMDSLVLAWRRDSSTAARIGLAKLSAVEQRNLAHLALSMYLRGRAASIGSHSGAAVDVTGLPRRSTIAHVTKVEDATNELVKLRNGAILELTGAYLAIPSYRDAVLLSAGLRCRLWVEGKRTYPCRLLKAPVMRGQEVSVDVLTGVNADGKLVRLSSGLMYEVQFQSYVAALWIAGSEILDFGDGRLLNLDYDSEIVMVSTIAR